jgi:para-nitrobenzyl esterase
MDDVVASTTLGSYQGSSTGGVSAFKGIPYAEAPFGDLRFEPPRPVAPHQGTRPALGYGATAPKPPYPKPINEILAEPVVEGDNPLNLNVWTPSLEGSAPVLVWIHGGAFQHGSGAVPTYDGTAFARDGVVCVTLNYRLGVDGFAFFDDRVPNRGLLDQICALEWVRDHIAAFGGDPARVTVAGESAGAMSISTLLAMPRAEGLFQQAVTQSGAASHTLQPATARKVVAGLAETLGIEPTSTAFAQVPRPDLTEGVRVFGRALAADRDRARWAELALDSMAFEPTVDGEVLPGPPLERIRAGAGSGVRLLTGTNREEMTLFLGPTGLLEMADDNILTFTAGLYGLNDDGVAVYRKARPEASAGDLILDVTTDWFFRIPALRVAEARGGDTTWVYEFDWRTPARDGKLGATHAVEVPFVFDTLAEPANEPLIGADAPQTLADTVHGAWVRFVTEGDPGWRPYTATGPGARAVQVFGVRSDLVLDPRGETREAWSDLR